MYTYTLYITNLRHPVSRCVHHAQVEQGVGQPQVSRHLSLAYIYKSRGKDIRGIISARISVRIYFIYSVDIQYTTNTADN